MATNIDSLSIEISAQADKADKSLDKLIGDLDRLSTSLGKANGSGITGLANGVDRLARAMGAMKNIDSRNFKTLATNIGKLTSINTAGLNSSAGALNQITRAFNGMQGVSKNAQEVGVLANNLSKLGYKSMTNAINNLPALTTGLTNLMTSLANAPQVSSNIIQMTNALANLASQGQQIGTVSRSLTRNMDGYSKSSTKASNSSWSLAAAFGKFYASYFLVIRGAKALYGAIESTADYIEAYNYFNVAFGKIASEWDYQWEEYGYENAEAYADSFTERMNDSLNKMSGVQVSVGADGKGLLTETGMKNLGLNIQEVTQYASQLASVTNSVGQTGETSLAAASAFTKLGADISSLFNIDYSDVMSNLQSGLIGQSRALYKYGIDITNATLQTYAYDLGLEKSVSEMTQAEKMQLRMIAILDQSRVSWGDQANTINSTSNQIRLLKNNLSETGMILGQLFIPILDNLLPALNGLSIAFKRLLTDIAGFMGISIDLDSFGQGYTETDDALGDLEDSYEDVTNAVEEYKNQILGFDEITKLQDTSATATLDTDTSGSIDLTDKILESTGEYEKAWQEAYDKMENRANEFADSIMKYFAPLEDLAFDISIGDWFEVGKDVSDIVTDIEKFISSAIKKVDWDEVGENVGDFLKGINWIEIIKEGLKLAVNIGEAIAEVWLEAFDTAPLETGILTALGAMKFTGLGKTLGGKIAKAITGSAFITAITGAFTSLGGIGGILTMDLATVIGAGSFAEIGLTVATGLAGGIISAFVGYNIGEEIYSLITGDKTDYDWSDYLGENFNADDWKAGWQMTVDDFVTGWDMIGQTFSNAIVAINDKLLEWNADLKEWQDERVDDWKTGMSTIGDAVSEKWTDIKDDWSTGFSIIKDSTTTWWKNRKDDWKTGMSTIATSVSSKWTDMKTSWSDGISIIKSAFSTFWTTDVKSWFSTENWTLSGIKDGLSKAFNNAIEGLKSIWNGFATWINEALTFDFDGFSKKFSVFGETIEVGLPAFEVSLGKLPTFETGGFPEDGLFFANHTELVGEFSNGKTAVANNAQITDGIRMAAYEGMKMALSEYNGNSNVNVTLQGDANNLFKVVQDKANDYTYSTGKPAFNI